LPCGSPHQDTLRGTRISTHAFVHHALRCAELELAPGVSHSYVLNSMQNLREQLRVRRNGTIDDLVATESEEILSAIKGLAVAARATGYTAYGSMCLHLTELIEDRHGGSRLSRSTLDLLSAWVEHSERYLRDPSERVAIAALIAQLNQPRWGSPLCQAEQDMLSRALLNPFT
jgi:hypothetical protein